MERVVLDTNCLIISFSRRSPYFKIWKNFFEGHFTLCVTNEIIAEYEEILTQKLGHNIAENIIKAILQSSNTLKCDAFFRFELIKSDPDDNKFVDCAIVANAHYIVTEDHHFDSLKNVEFPRVNVIGIDEFMRLID